jgi:hypothetical protein
MRAGFSYVLRAARYVGERVSDDVGEPLHSLRFIAFRRVSWHLGLGEHVAGDAVEQAPS